MTEKEQEEILKKLQNENLRKLKKAVQIKKEVDEFVKKLKEQEQWLDYKTIMQSLLAVVHSPL